MNLKPLKDYRFWLFLFYAILALCLEKHCALNYFVSSLWFSVYLYDKLEENIKKDKEKQADISKVTRFEVIDHRQDQKEQGRVIVAYNVDVEIQAQDKGKTIKIFLTNKNKNGK